VHRVPAVAAELVRAIKLGQLNTAARQLKQARILIQHLPKRSHILPTILAYQPHRVALPFANMLRVLADKIKIYRFAVW
jgi:hypothetical protein